jgi:hypothetical protein
MNKTVLLAAAAVLAISAGSASAAGPVVSSKGFDVHATRLTTPSAGLKVLYSQNSNNGGTGIVSQQFGSSYPQLFSQGADDFIVPTGSTWKVKEVDVTGVYFNGPGPATSENVYFYKDKRGLPGALKTSYMNIVGADNGGSFTIKIPTTRLRAGHYWVSVQANLAFAGGAGGEWGWEDTTAVLNNPSAWQNPPGGFGVGCTTWGVTSTCLGLGTDFMFALKGK